MDCSICKKQLKKIFSYGKIPLCDNFQRDKKKSINQKKFDMSFMSCETCHHIELKNKVNPKKIYTNYPYYSERSPDLEKHFDKYSNFMEQFRKKKKQNYHLDIGCNDGILIKKTKKKFKTFGIEPGKEQAKLAKKHGKVFNSYMTFNIIKSSKLDNKFDVITTNNTIANIINLNDFMKGVSAALKEGGILIVETLNLNLLLKNNVYEMFNHEHFHYFSKNSLVFLARKYNLNFQKISFFKTKGATMRIVFKKDSKNIKLHYHSKILKKKNIKEKISLFLKQLSKIKKNVHKLVLNNKNMIGGFGSSPGTTIWIYLLGLEKKLKYITDDNKFRHNYYVPGTAIKVLSPKNFYQLNLSYTLIFAWRFTNLIKQKHKNKLLNNKLINIIKIIS